MEFYDYKEISFLSDEFWNSQYGRSAKSSLRKSVLSVASFVNNQPLFGSINQLSPDKVVVNLSKQYNLKVGDRLKVLRQADITQWEGIQDTVIAKSTASPSNLYH
ncbi:hypothetical protein JQC92_19785 [Shewanella sp. 202IG2-18]|uniref:hypothetical protein n=1 Tax=Parashewanella hymeniacidonis TaxID=2807618 RepID=UPI0019600652|nr:hypothetical protein [Parashewanella hymeniacidonis]MBM7074239.1 hypothetical protein [Parashewanella hymeniacidonis]